MIRSVEIISGGASATYGADAMGGVSNFLLRRDFQGLQTDFQYGITDLGDNNEVRASLLTGTKFGDGRGSVVFAGGVLRPPGAYDRDRKFYKDAYKDRSVGGNALFLFGANGWSQNTRPTSKLALGAVTNRDPSQTVGFSGTVGGSLVFQRQRLGLQRRRQTTSTPGTPSTIPSMAAVWIYQPLRPERLQQQQRDDLPERSDRRR